MNQESPKGGDMPFPQDGRGAKDEVPADQSPPGSNHSKPSAPAPSSQDLAERTTGWPASARMLGDYELLEELAHGPDSWVYRAHQKNLDRIVALKVYSAGSSASDEDVQQFYRGARAAAELNHPSIVPIYDIGQEQGHPYIAMGFVAGQSLAQRVASSGVFEYREAAEFIKQAAEAVQYAHEKGVIHRNLSSASILLNQRGRPRITAFDLAKYHALSGVSAAENPSVAHLSFIAPELIAGKGEETCPASDVYSLGAVLYFLLAGRPPFEGSSPTETIARVLRRKPVRPSTFTLGLPRELEKICLKCLRKRAKDRYPSAALLANDLGSWLHGERIALPLGKRILLSVRGFRIQIVAAAAVFGVLVTPFVLRRWEPKSPIRPAAPSVSDVEKRGPIESSLPPIPIFEGHAGIVTSVAISHDGRLAISGGFDRTTRIWEIRTARALHVFQEQPDVVWAVALSRDGRFAVSGGQDKTGTSDFALRLWDLKGKGEARRLSGHYDIISGLTFSSDSRSILSSSWDQTVRIWNAESGEQRQSIPQGEPLTSLAISPDGRYLLLGTARAHLRLWDLQGSRASLNLEGNSDYVESVAFSPEGDRAVAGCNDKTARIWNLRSGRLLHALRGHTGAVRGVAYSPDGRRVLTASFDRTVRLWDVESGAQLQSFEGSSGEVYCVAFSPNGRFALSGGADGKIRVWNMPPQEQ